MQKACLMPECCRVEYVKDSQGFSGCTYLNSYLLTNQVRWLQVFWVSFTDYLTRFEFSYKTVNSLEAPRMVRFLLNNARFSDLLNIFTVKPSVHNTVTSSFIGQYSSESICEQNVLNFRKKIVYLVRLALWQRGGGGLDLWKNLWITLVTVHDTLVGFLQKILKRKNIP